MSEMHEEAPEEQVNITFDDGVEEEEQPEEAVAEPGATPEPPPEEPAEEKVSFNEEQQQIFNTEIGKKVAKVHEATQRAEAAERRAKELEEKLGVDQAPEIPPPPDPYAPDYAEQFEARDAAVKARTEWETKQTLLTQQQEQQKWQAEQARQQEIQESISAYTQRSEKLGITAQELQQAGGMINQIGINGEVAMHILGDPVGPQITTHLAKNLTELSKINQMTPTQAAVYIESTIKPAASKGQKKVNPPPEPPEHLTGRGEPEKQRGPKGATFE